MDSLTLLPSDLAVLADASARGAAPPLGPPNADGAPAAAAAPFALCLARLAGELPGGEAWPAAGKELPISPLEAEAESEPAGALAPAALLPVVPAVLADAAPQAGLLTGEPPPMRPAAGSLSSAHAAAALPPSGGPTAPDGQAQPLPVDLDPLAALTTPEAPLEAAELQAAGASARTTSAPSWLEAFTAERRLPRPPAAAPSQAAATASAPLSAEPRAAHLPNTVAVAAAETASTAHGLARRTELATKTLTPVVAAAEGASPTTADWLPPAAGHGAPTSAAAPSAAPAAQPPVDLRSPSWQEAFASRMQMLVDTRIGEAHLKLNPPELGAVDIKISLVDDKTFVQLTAATAAARDELAQSLPRLRELFTVSGLELGGASVHDGREGQQGGRGYGADPRAADSAFAAFAADADEAPAWPPRRAPGRIDVFA